MEKQSKLPIHLNAFQLCMESQPLECLITGDTSLHLSLIITILLNFLFLFSPLQLFQSHLSFFAILACARFTNLLCSFHQLVLKGWVGQAQAGRVMVGQGQDKKKKQRVSLSEEQGGNSLAFVYNLHNQGCVGTLDVLVSTLKRTDSGS